MSSLLARRPKRLLPWLVGLGLAGLLAFGVGWAVVRRNQPDYEIAELTAAVETGAFTVRITASGEVKPVRTVNLSPKSAGTVETLFVEQGDRVTQGQVIAQMDSDQLNAQIRQNEAAIAEARSQLAEAERGATGTDIGQAQAALEAAEAAFREAQARTRLAEDEAVRSQQLFDQGAISRSDLDRAVSERRSAQASESAALARIDEAAERLRDLQNGNRPEMIEQAAARLNRVQAQLEAVEVQLADTQVRAPFDGIITQRFASEGAFVTPTATASDVTSATSTAIVALASGLEVIAEVPEADIGKIEVGQEAEIQAEAFPEEVFEGRVKLVAPEAIERQNVTVFQVRVELISGLDRLRSNMNTTVAFLGSRQTDALVIPAVAVITQAGEAGVLVPGAEREIEFQPVVLGSQVGDRIQVIEGLEEGDLVFIDLPPGQSLENLTFGRGNQ